MCMDILYKLYYFFTHCLFLRQAVNSLTGLSALIGAKEKESKKRGEEREWGRCGPGFTQPWSTPPSHWALSAERPGSKNIFPVLSVLTLQMWGSQAKNQPVNMGGSNPCLMIRIGVPVSRPLGWVHRYSWAVARALSFSVALASAPIHKNTCCGRDWVFVIALIPRAKYQY